MNCFFAQIEDPAVDAFLSGSISYEQLAHLEPNANIEVVWQVVHYVLTGTDGYNDASEPPLNFIFRGDRNFKIEGGDGSGHVLRASTVQMIASALSRLDMATLCRQCDYQTAAKLDLYGFDPDMTQAEHAQSYAYFLLSLKEFFSSASQKHRAVLVYFG